MGGLGNQMFQYAAGRCLSHLHKTNLQMDLSFLNKNSMEGITKRKFGLDCFELNLKEANESDIAGYKKKMGNKYIRTFQRKLPILFDSVYFAESGSTFHKEFYNLPAKVYLEGYWQCEKYFLPVEEVIQKDFCFKKALDAKNENLMSKIKNSVSVSLHVRRGDYISASHTSNIYAPCSAEYYNSAVEIIASKVSNIELFIFSDEIHWCKENLKFSWQVNYIDNNSNKNNYIDMQLMSACKHNVIANSSFSWWAAWLNNNPNKIIIAPAKWYSASHLSDSDLIPDKWLRI